VGAKVFVHTVIRPTAQQSSCLFCSHGVKKGAAKPPSSVLRVDSDVGRGSAQQGIQLIGLVLLGRLGAALGLMLLVDRAEAVVVNHLALLGRS